MKTLTLSLKKKWYDMIASGEKTEEYREIKTFWINRLMTWFDGHSIGKYYDSTFPISTAVKKDLIDTMIDWRKIDFVTFTLGYPKKGDMSRRMTFRVNRITIDTGRIEWGAMPTRLYFVIKLGERIQGRDRV